MSRSLWRLVPTERPKEGPYTQFAPLAEALDLPYAGAPELTVRINSAPVTFALDINSGTVVGVIMTIGLEGPPSGNAKMTLRKETSTDRDGKRRGINREVQTGDREFDSEVYVDSDASDFETKRILSKPTVRAAVRELIRADCTGIEISKSTLVGKFAPAVCQGAGLVNALEALMIVASAGAPREKGEPRHGAWLQTLTTLVMVVMVASIPIAWSTLSLQYNGWLAFFGAILGLGLALVWRPLVARVTSGDSGSFARYRERSR